MSQALHSLARTTHLIRKEIRESGLSQAALARLYQVSRKTIRKWSERESTEDRSHRPDTLLTTLTPAQERVVVALRTTLLLATDDLLAITRAFVNPVVSRSGLGRCLRRHGISNLRDLAGGENDEPGKKKSSKDREPGFIHVDIQYLPMMPDETERRCLFVAIDRATRWVHMEIYADQTDHSSTDFLGKLMQACPIRIVKLLTDQGSQFAHRFGSNKKDDDEGLRLASGEHEFDLLCQQFKIEHQRIAPRHRQATGMVERCNGGVSEIVEQSRFSCAAELESTLRNYLEIYHHGIAQRALNYQTPIRALEEWRKKRPGLFVRGACQRCGADGSFAAPEIGSMPLCAGRPSSHGADCD